MAANRSASLTVHLALLWVQVTFGAFHVIAKVTMDHVPPLAVAGVRVAAATPLLLAAAWWIDRRLPRWADLPHLALLGLLGVFANQLLFISGLELTSATSASILMPSIPVFAAGVAVLAGVERPGARRVQGIALTVIGALITLDPRRVVLGDTAALGSLLVLLNCLSYASFLVLMRPLLRRLPPATVIAWSFVLGGSGVVAVTWPHMAALELTRLPAAALWGLGYIILVPTAMNYFLNTWAVGRSSPTLVATYTTLQPVAATVLAAILLSERPGILQAVGAAFIVGGLYRVTTDRRPAADAPPVPAD